MRLRTVLAGFLLLQLLGAVSSLAASTRVAHQREDVIIRFASRDDLRAVAQKFQIQIQYEFRYAPLFVAATVPVELLRELQGQPGVLSVERDGPVPCPRPIEEISVDGFLGKGEGQPNTYYGPALDLTHVRPLHEAGNMGQGVVVGVIDSGTSRFATALCDGPCETGTRVLGGESFVPDEEDATAADNYPHGTQVASIIGANAVFEFARTSRFATGVRTYCPSCALDLPDRTLIPMVGQAPGVHFYALKVFPRSGAASPRSRVLQAMERAIELRTGKLPELRVVNMSLGGATLFPGGDLYQAIIDAMADAGMSLSVSAANNGPAGITVATPGTSKNILTVAAANNATYARISYYNSTGQDGYLSRPDDAEQVANYSSRGPNADGRPGPVVIANGSNTWLQGPSNSLSLGSGTSFSAPVISGILALLYNFKPTANPGEVRAAVMLGAHFDQIPTATMFDQGRGYVDATQTVKILATSPDPIPDEGPSQRSVSRNIEIATGQPVIDESSFQREISDLRPSERREFYFLVERETRSFTLSVPEVTMELPLEQQNPLFGDRVILAVHSAKLSAIGSGGDYIFQAYLPLTGFSQTFTNLEPGVMRITFQASGNNVGRVAHGALFGEEERAALPRPRFRGELTSGESRIHTLEVPKGIYVLQFELYWPDDWSVFPANDLDMIITTPSGDVDTQGMSLRDPEVAFFDQPAPGTYSLQIQGTTIYRDVEPYEVRVTMQ